METAEKSLHISLKADTLFEFLGVPITNALLSTWLVVGVLIALGVFVGMRRKLVPGKVQLLFETLFSYVLDYMEETLESRKMAERFFPLVITLFIFILFANLAGLLPGIGSIGIYQSGHFIELFRPVSTDLNSTLALTIIAFLVIEITGVLTLGILKYGSKFVNFKSVLGFLVGIIELFSELARLISFSFRLFGNMFAGKVLILVALFFVPVIVPVPLMLFEVFVSFIQAAIFALLTLFFIKLAITPLESH
ncbi:MAG: F0F1 ATP synthase subunit A [Candidatus Paceibacterota bacterium]